LRRRFEEMNVIQFEDWEDTGSEYIKFELDAQAPDAVGQAMEAAAASAGD